MVSTCSELVVAICQSLGLLLCRDELDYVTEKIRELTTQYGDIGAVQWGKCWG